MLTNPVLIAVIIMSVLALLKVNVLVAILIAAISGGLIAGLGIETTMGTLIGGMGGASQTALSYILLGALAVTIGHTGVTDKLVAKIGNTIQDKRVLFVLIIAGIASLSQNLIPVHIAFIPILIPPLLGVMNKLKIDRRAVATALTFGLKAPYLMIPAGFGLQFHEIVATNLTDNGVDFAISDVWKSTFLPGVGMIIGLLVAVFITYRGKRDYEDREIIGEKEFDEHEGFTKEHWGAIIGAVAAFAVQLITESLPLGALIGLLIMLAFGSFKFSEMDDMINGGIRLMGFIAFVMLVASGFGAVLRETGGVEQLVDAAVGLMGNNQLLAAIIMLLIGLLVTMGIGTSFGTIPIVATIYVPLGVGMGFSPAAIAALIGTAGALGDAGSPASDSTLGPTAGLNADGQHNHIWDTCVPTFLHFNIALIVFGTIAAMVL